MTGSDLAKAYHNAVSTLADGYGHVLEVLSTENAALRMRVAALESELLRAQHPEAAIPPMVSNTDPKPGPKKTRSSQGGSMNPGDVGE